MYTDKKTSKLEMKDPTHWPFKQNKAINNLFNKCKSHVERKFEMPIENGKTKFNICEPIKDKELQESQTPIYEQSEGLIAVQGPNNLMFNITLFLSFKMVRKNEEVEIINKVVLFVET